jgi:type I restriction enzyme, S subunit
VPDRQVICPSYLFQALRNLGPQIRHLASSTTMPILSKSRFEKLSIPLPPLAEQSRIAAILDHADALRATRRQILAAINTLSEAVFFEMFGDPVANQYRLPRIPLRDLLSGITSGESPVCEARAARNDEWGILKLGAVSYGRFNPNENKAFLGDVSGIRRVEVQRGDFLFSRKNTKELVGATVVVHDVPPRRLLPDLIFRLDLVDGAIEPEYLRVLLANHRKRPQVVALASGSASSMSNISQARLMGLIVEVPPIDRQSNFAARVQQIDRQRAIHEQALVELDSLFASLQSGAFSGQL